MKRALVCGAGGFIGHHMVKRLREEGYFVHGVDLKYPEFSLSLANVFTIADLRDPEAWDDILEPDIDCIYQFAADMGGAGFVFTEENDAEILHNNALINLNAVNAALSWSAKKIFYASSACIYPAYNQTDPNNPNCREESAYPANPDSEYGWEKLFSEHLYLAYHKNHGLDVRIARYHNIFGPEGTWKGGREKVPAAICRKVIETPNHGDIEIWGDGLQTRSFLYIDDCIDATRKLVESSFLGPVNIGSEEIVSINDLLLMVIGMSNKKFNIKHIQGPLGVRGRNSNNDLFKEVVDSSFTPRSLLTGLWITYEWIESQINFKKREK